MHTHCPGQTDSMTRLRPLDFLLFFLLHRACGQDAEPTFRAVGHAFEMGYCFGVDYIVVYRSRPAGDQLLGNSSDDAVAVTPPADLRGRVQVSKRDHLLGLQIRNLRHEDSGVYRRECWQSRAQVSQHTQRLIVCNHEVEATEFAADEASGRAELRCGGNSTGLEGASVSWYGELQPLFRMALLVDGGVSLDPLVDEMRGVVEVREGGTSLSIDSSFLKHHHEFYCLVMREKKCLAFQNLFQPIHSESRDVYASPGERVVLGCPFEDDTQQWETPAGGLNSSGTRNKQMYISMSGTSKDYSLVISAVTKDHVGEYSCITPSQELQYSLFLCSEKPAKENLISEDGRVSLECDIGQEDYQGLKWYRQGPSGEYNLIHDTEDDTVPVPKDLEGRMTLSKNGSELNLSGVEAKGGESYTCVVLEDTEITVDDGGGEYTYDDEESEDDQDYDNFIEPGVPVEVHTCIFKQRNTLLLIKTTKTADIGEPIGRRPSDPETTSTPQPPSNNPIPAWIGGTVAVLVLVGVIGTVVIMRRRRAAANRREPDPQSMRDLQDCSEPLNSPNA